jgi:hypothetical protein
MDRGWVAFLVVAALLVAALILAPDAVRVALARWPALP